MATLKRGLIKKGRYYHYRFKVLGIEHAGSTRCTDLTSARIVLEQLRREVILGHHGVKKAPTVQALLEVWLKIHKGKVSSKHLRNTEQMARLWILPAFGKLSLNHVDTPRVQDLIATYRAGGRSPASANLLLRTLKLLFNWAREMGYLHALPFSVKPLRFQQRPRPVVPLAKLQAFFTAMDGLGSQLGVMARIMVGLGLRESEVLGMRWEWVDPEQRVYTVGKAKSKRSRALPVPGWVWDAIMGLPKTLSPWIFPAADGRPHREGYASKAVRKAAKACGLGSLGAHRLRATFATNHAAIGTPLSDLQELMGHADLATTRGYIEEDMARKRVAQEKLAKLVFGG